MVLSRAAMKWFLGMQIIIILSFFTYTHSYVYISLFEMFIFYFGKCLACYVTSLYYVSFQIKTHDSEYQYQSKHNGYWNSTYTAGVIQTTIVTIQCLCFQSFHCSIKWIK